MSRATHTLLVTGRPGVGKTTALRRAADLLADLDVRGFYTEEVRDTSGRRTGFRALPFGPRAAGGGGHERDHGGADAGEGAGDGYDGEADGAAHALAGADDGGGDEGDASRGPGDGAGGTRDGGRLIASVEFRGGPRVSRYGVDVAAVDEVAGRHLADPDADVVLVDEIGKMECFSDRFVERVRELVLGDVPLVATVARRGGGLVRQVKEAPGTELRELTRENRDRAPDMIEGWVRERAG